MQPSDDTMSSAADEASGLAALVKDHAAKLEESSKKLNDRIHSQLQSYVRRLEEATTQLLSAHRVSSQIDPLTISGAVGDVDARLRTGVAQLLLHEAHAIGVAFMHATLLISYLAIYERLSMVVQGPTGKPEVNVLLFEWSIIPTNVLIWSVLVPLGGFVKTDSGSLFWKQMLRASLPLFLLTCLIWQSVLSTGRSPLYSGVEFVLCFVFVPVQVLASAKMAKQYFKRRRSQRLGERGTSTATAVAPQQHPATPSVESGGGSREESGGGSRMQQRRRSSVRDAAVAVAVIVKKGLPPRKKRGTLLASTASALAGLGVVFAYPFFIIPTFRTSSTEGKLATVLILHPLVMETGLFVMRGFIGDRQGRDPFRDHANLFLVEATCGFIRRFLISNIGSLAVTNTAVALTSVEELLLRTSMRARYNFVRKHIRRKPPIAGEALARKNEVWSCQINVSAIVEVVSILTAAFASISLARNAYVVNLGYTELKPGSVEAVVSEYAVIQSAMLQIAAEVLVDAVCFWLEQRQGIPVIGWYYERLANAPAMVLYHALSFFQALHWLLYSYKTAPFWIWCPGGEVIGDYDPCGRCHEGRGYELWENNVCGQMANTTNASSAAATTGL